MARPPEPPDAHQRALARPARLRAVRRSRLLDARPSERYDRITRLAATTTGSPTALISIVDDQEQVFTSQVGLPQPWASLRRTALSHSFCQYVAASREPLVVADAREDARLRDNLAVPEIGVVAYAGVPIDVDGQTIGSLCAIRSEPHVWTEEELGALRDLASFVVDQVRVDRARRDVRCDRAQAVEAAGLTAREAEVFELVADGRSNREIGDLLGVGLDTTKKHVSRVLHKLGVDSRAAAAARYR